VVPGRETAFDWIKCYRCSINIPTLGLWVPRTLAGEECSPDHVIPRKNLPRVSSLNPIPHHACLQQHPRHDHACKTTFEAYQTIQQHELELWLAAVPTCSYCSLSKRLGLLTNIICVCHCGNHPNMVTRLSPISTQLQAD